MKQVLQNMRTGSTMVIETPIPQARPKTALVRTAVSLVSAGTERMLVDFASKNLLEKARSRPDLAKQVLDNARRVGVLSTVQTVYNRLDQPITLGYSSSGTIMDCGEGLIGFRPGDHVVCAGGGNAVHAEYAVIPQNLLAHMPDDVDFESGAFATMGAIAMNGFRLAKIQLGESVAIIGLGLLGLITAKLAQAAGCAVLGIDTNPDRVKFAKKLGFNASTRANAEKSGMSFTMGHGFDAVLICADTPSADTVVLAGQIARDRGHVISLGVVGIDLPRKLYYEKELFFQVSRSSGPGRYDPKYEEEGIDYPMGYIRWTEGRNLEGFVNLINAGKLTVKDLITHRFPVEKATAAYQLITGKESEPFLGVLLTYTPKKGSLQTRIPITNKEGLLHPHKGEIVAGVLGAGNYANAVFLPAITSVGGAHLQTIVSASGSSASYAAKKYKFAFASSSENDIFQDKKVNTIVILTRHNEHARQVVKSLQLGKYVYCEKPLAINEEELTQVEKALSKKDHPVLMVGFNRRFSPFGQALKEFLSDRREPLYAHYRVNAGWLPLNHWQHDLLVGGGRIIGEGCHFIDFITFLVGQPPSSIFAQALPDKGKYRQDNVLITLEFPDGSLGSLAYLANGDKGFPKEYMEVFCGGRIGILDDFTHLTTISNGQRKEQHSRFSQNKGHRAAWKAFLTCIKDGTEPPISYQDLIHVSKATLTAMNSINTGLKVTLN
jgi:predicted dehydrogenase/threonine dehydrogenase-like Zn-dependent dehydrogenase